MKLFYLAKNGIISGPFTNDELTQIQASGEIQNYSWIWQDHWKPIDPMPAEDPSQRVSKLNEIDSLLSVVCHDFKKAVSGVLSEVTARGCVLIVTEEGHPARFHENSMLQMNLMIEKTGQSMNFPVRFLRQIKSEQGWNYLFQWSQVPGILSAE